MKKAITSSNPIKAKVVAALKAATGGKKITRVFQIGRDIYQGDVLRPNPESKGKWENLGTHKIFVEGPVKP